MSQFAMKYQAVDQVANKVKEGRDYFIIGWMIAIHLIALLALFTFSWANLAVLIGGWFASTCLGITFGYHRLMTHRSFKAPRWLERVAGTFGVLALQGGPLEWVAHHRMHHAFTDTPNDPHNARQGFWHAHIGWLFKVVSRFDDPAIMKRYARDIASDPYLMWLQNGYAQIGIQVALAIALWSIGGFGMVIWGIFARLVVGYHGTWLVNSATHFFGYRRYQTDDLSRNSWWVALLTWGEGWHNNHHANQAVAKGGYTWYEFDMTWYLIWALKKLGMVWDVNLPVVVNQIIDEGYEDNENNEDGEPAGFELPSIQVRVPARSHLGYSQR